MVGDRWLCWRCKKLISNSRCNRPKQVGGGDQGPIYSVSREAWVSMDLSSELGSGYTPALTPFSFSTVPGRVTK
ncbi:unnamed protein product [Urochloa humidicola]